MMWLGSHIELWKQNDDRFKLLHEKLGACFYLTNIEFLNNADVAPFVNFRWGFPLRFGQADINQGRRR